MKSPFYTQKIKEIKIWAWLATVGPMTLLGFLFFSHYLGFNNLYTSILTVGAVVVLVCAVIWWWWAIWTIARVTLTLGETVSRFNIVDEEIQVIKKEIKKDLQNPE